MKTKGTILKRKIHNKEYFYHKYLEDGKQVNNVISEQEAYKLCVQFRFTDMDLFNFERMKFKLNVNYGEKLYLLGLPYKSFKRRFLFDGIQNFLIPSEWPGRVLALYGLRRTGKTTLIFQTINNFSFDDFSKAAYIKCSKGKTIYDLFDDLETLIDFGFKYIFIDEVTLLEDFVKVSSTLSDIFGLQAKIVLSGTDSLGFLIASYNELYGRTVMVHTTYIPFHEFATVLENKTIDDYIEYGGTMSKEGIDYNKVVLRNGYKVNEYVDSSIIHNIIHSLKNIDNGKYFFNLYSLYQRNELENVINRIVEDSNHRFAINIIEEDFKSHDYGSLKQILHSSENYKEYAHVLDDVDEEKFLKDFMNALNIINKENQTFEVSDEVFKELHHYLEQLDVIAEIKHASYPSYRMTGRDIFTQPGLRYSQAKTLIEVLFKDKSLQQYDRVLLDVIKEKLLSDVKGRMIEEMIIYETSTFYEETFKFSFLSQGEFDMVVLNPFTRKSELYEIKYSKVVNENQYKSLKNKDFNEIISKHYYPISKRVVLYRGEDKVVDDIEFKNIEQYLLSL